MSLLSKIIEKRNEYWTAHAEAKTNIRDQLWNLYVKYRDLAEYVEKKENYLCLICSYNKQKCITARRYFIPREDCLSCLNDKATRAIDLKEFECSLTKNPLN